MGKIRGEVSAASKHCLVAAAGGHRRERIHALCPRGAGHKFHGERRDARLRDLLHDFGGAERPQESDERLAAAHQGKIGLAGNVIRAVAQHLHHNVGGAEHGGAIGHDLRALFDVHRVGIARLLAGSGFHDDFESRLDEIGNGYGNERNATFPGIAFFRNSNDHAALILSVPMPVCRFGVSGSARAVSGNPFMGGLRGL